MTARVLVAVVAAVLLLTGCAAKGDVVSFDRGAFALTYGKLSQALTTACKDKKLSEADCTRLAEVDATVTKQLTTPTKAPSGIDMDAVMKLLGVAAKLAL
jgi:molybdenum cofactor biosynthesis enzyme